jgi:hypothetical protein
MGAILIMPIMMSKLYDALISGNVPEDKARSAAEEIANYENRFAKIEADLLLLKWMVGFNIGLVLLALGKLFK